MTTQKVQFGEARKQVTIALPSFPGAEVTLYDSLLVHQQRQLQQKYPKLAELGHSDNIQATAEMVKMCFVSWNFVDQDGKDLEPTNEVFDQMPGKDYQLIVRTISGQEEKKKEI